MLLGNIRAIFACTRVRKIALYVCVFLGIICCGGVLVVDYYMSPTASSKHNLAEYATEMVSITVAKGSNTTTIAKELATHNLIRSPFVFKVAVRYRGIGTQLRAGTYQLSRDMSLMRILDELKKGQVEFQTFTVPEGITAAAIAKLWEKAGLGTAAAFTAAMQTPELLQQYLSEGVSVEGYLFPNTYKFTKGSKAPIIVEMMLGESQKRWNDTLAEEAKKLGLTRHEVITLASIIQREAASISEIPRISSVFHNRLKHNWRLQADPTVLYALGDPDRLLTKKDLKFVSPYNTYLHKGLPPGPIGNPGMESILGALRPEQTSYYYFVATNATDSLGRRKHHFSKTLTEHNRVIYQIRKQRTALKKQ